MATVEYAFCIDGFPDYYSDIGENQYSWQANYAFDECARIAIEKTGLKSKYGESEHILVKVYRLALKNGQIEKTFDRTIKLDIPQGPVTEKEFGLEMQFILSDIPVDFHGFLSGIFHDGAASLEEELGRARELAPIFSSLIKTYTKSVLMNNGVESWT